MRLPAPGGLLTVSDLLGRPVYSVRPTGTTATLDLAGLRPGTYLVQADGAAGRSTRKLVVE